jgi:glycogen(starch) synthase
MSSMHLLLSTPTFWPDVGGLELLTLNLASRFRQLGHQVTLVTRTNSEQADDFGFAVVRSPRAGELFHLLKQSDVHLQTQLNLTYGWPHFVISMPLVVAHQNRTPRSGLRGFMKHRLLQRGANISCSKAIARTLDVPSHVIGSAYSDALFPTTERSSSRAKDILFVGRLIEDKGASDLVAALEQLRARGMKLSASIIGDGAERQAIERRLDQSKLRSSVAMLGSQPPEETAQAMREHRILVVPSRWEEPFGIVALEGIASGCVVVGTHVGGLPEAIGEFGLLIPKADPIRLADELERLLKRDGLAFGSEEARSAHLSRHTIAAVADRYLEVITEQVAHSATLPAFHDC